MTWPQGWRPRRREWTSTYTTPVQHNNPMEPHAAIAAWDDAGLTIWDSTQGPSADRDTIAATLGLPPEQVRVISPHVGGGFGSKGTTRPHAILAALAARESGPAGQGGAEQAADVHADRAPDADDPAA